LVYFVQESFKHFQLKLMMAYFVNFVELCRLSGASTITVLTRNAKFFLYYIFYFETMRNVQ